MLKEYKYFYFNFVDKTIKKNFDGSIYFDKFYFFFQKESFNIYGSNVNAVLFTEENFEYYSNVELIKDIIQ